MLRRFACYVLKFCLLAGALPSLAAGQDTAEEDAPVDTIRQLPQISAEDQRRIGNWVQAQIDRLAATPEAGQSAARATFRTRFRTQVDNPNNSPAFRVQFPAQTAVVAAARFATPNLPGFVAASIARVLVDMDRLETFSGLIAGLKVADEPARYLCAAGLAAQRKDIAADKERLEQVVRAVREAALVETSPVVLSRLYLCLAEPGQVAAVFDAYMAVLEKRLQIRRSGALVVDGAEVDAFEFFRNPAVLGALSQPQKEQLVRNVATFMRFDAERFNTRNLPFDETDILERRLDAEEEILAAPGLAVAGRTGKVRDALSASDTADAVRQAYAWVGDPTSKEPGGLNSAPWNLPIGAP